MSRTAHDRTPAPPRPVVVAALAVLGLAAAFVSVALVAGNEEDREPRVRAALVGWIILAYLTCGLVAWSRRPDNRLGPLMVIAAFGPFVSVLGEAEADLPQTIGEALRILPVALFLHVFLAYPTGRLERRPERIVVAGTYVAAVGLGLVVMLLGGFGDANQLALVDAPNAADAVQVVQRVATAVLSLAAIGILVARRRRSGRALRRSREVLFDSFVLALLLLAIGLFAKAVEDRAPRCSSGSCSR